uniref:Uncharacterized protein n=1 Tax=Sinocyclocheilus grahami TaxID=75366 RepID=A0A672MII5_SINGR
MVLSIQTLCCDTHIFNSGPVLEPEGNHVSALSDASKKRVIEDTEDWHPRTGTSQSRSFRILAQITGTENGTHSFSPSFTLLSASQLKLKVFLASLL